MPENTTYVGRGSRWGNPFPVGDYKPLHMRDGDRWYLAGWAEITPDMAVHMYRQYIIGADLTPLAGRNLACWCPPDQPCHADVLLELANPKETP